MKTLKLSLVVVSVVAAVVCLTGGMYWGFAGWAYVAGFVATR